MSANFKPKGIQFQDRTYGQLLLVNMPDHWAHDWLCYKHPDGDGWVTLRKATDADKHTVAEYQKGITR